MVPELEDRLVEGSDEDIAEAAALVRIFSFLTLEHELHPQAQADSKGGASGARSDDTKILKSAVLDWITPRGLPLNPPLKRILRRTADFITSEPGLC